MARSLSKAQIIGFLGDDPEMRKTTSGTPVVNLDVATDESYKDADGTLVKQAEWHRVVAFGPFAKTIAEYLKKGSRAYFEGKLETNVWKDRDGNERRTTQIKVSEMMMLDGRPAEAAHAGGAQRAGQAPGT